MKSFKIFYKLLDEIDKNNNINNKLQMFFK